MLASMKGRLIVFCFEALSSIYFHNKATKVSLENMCEKTIHNSLTEMKQVPDKNSFRILQCEVCEYQVINKATLEIIYVEIIKSKP